VKETTIESFRNNILFVEMKISKAIYYWGDIYGSCQRVFEVNDNLSLIGR
jgi:hypothetical protein